MREVLRILLGEEVEKRWKWVLRKMEAVLVVRLAFEWSRKH